MTVKLLTKQYLEFLSLKIGCTGSSESTLVKMPHCWKSHVASHYCIFVYLTCGPLGPLSPGLPSCPLIPGKPSLPGGPGDPTSPRSP